MRRSKLEMNVDILRVLARYGPLKLTQIACKANVNCSALKQYLGFLKQHNLVDNRIIYKKKGKPTILYIITKKGRTTLKYFSELNKGFQETKKAYMVPELLR
ncbi:MAG: winged helix-turn-helix domain-containing protein [Candidatus Bathyarchaeota archaeon]|jgi:predicted transcriptional regulator